MNIRQRSAGRWIPVLLALVLAASAPAASGQAADTVASKVSGLLIRFPAASAFERDAAADELLALGPAAVADLCGRLAAPGAADDSLVRFALDALVVRTGGDGSEGERRMITAAMVASLGRTDEPENAAFLIGLLQRSGRADIAVPLSRYLHDPKLADPAARALAATRTPEAERALIKALPGAPEGADLPIIQSLGEMRSRLATRTLLPLADSADESLRAAVLDALAQTGDPAARPALDRIGVDASAAERAAAAPRLLLYTRRLAEKEGGRSEALEITRRILDHYTSPMEGHIRAAALSVLADYAEERETREAIVAAALSDDPTLRQRAMELASGFPSGSSIERWIGLLDEASPEARAGIIRMLAVRSEEDVLSAIRLFTRADDPSIRRAVAAASARLGGPEVLNDILPLFLSGDEEDIRAAGAALGRLPAEVALPAAASLLPEASFPSQVVLLGILADRGASEYVGLILDRARSDEAKVRAAAAAALETTAREGEIPALIGLIMEASTGAETASLQNALVAAAGRIPDRERRADLLLGELAKTEGAKRAELLRPMSRIGGSAALAAVISETESPDPQVQAVAVFTLSNWPDEAAIGPLLGLARKATDRKTRHLALQGVARLVSESGAEAQVRLEILGDALRTAVETEEKGAVLGGFAALGTEDALAVVVERLDDPVLRTRAAALVARMVMPGLGRPGLRGRAAADALKKALPCIDNEYDRELADQRVSDLLREEGFVPLFNGKDLSGWKGLAADPPKRAAMTPAALAAAQAEADADMRAHWKVVEGVLVFDGGGRNLLTDRDYGDFELFVDWMIQPQGDSGIYLRGSPQIQIWDPGQWPEGSGGLYNNQLHPRAPLVGADRPVGEWNTFSIRLEGERVTVRLNGTLVVDDVVMENYWDRSRPIDPAGPIELQAHSTPLRFKNILIREIGAKDGGGAATGGAGEERAGEFEPLFNGRDLSGWAGDTDGYAVEDGAIVVLAKSGGGNLFTARDYADFVLRFEFRLTPGANNGIGIRTPPEGDAAYVGMEIQVLDDAADQYKDLKPYQVHGSIYGVVPARRGFLKPAGEWNEEEIDVRGRRVTVVLNGTTIVDADLDEVSRNGTIDGRDHPGLARASGRISLCGHGSRVEFRNLRIKEFK